MPGPAPKDRETESAGEGVEKTSIATLSTNTGR